MPIYRGTGGSTPLNDNVTEDEVGLLLTRFDALASELERQTGVVATDLAQAVTAANQAVTDSTQQKLFAQAAAREASGYAVEAFESKQTAQQQAATATTQATQAIEAKDEASVSAEAARLSELAADQAREEADQFSVVAQSQATTATLKAQEALESAQSASDSAQSASDSAQSAVTSRIIAAGQANNAVNAANAAELSETNAAQSASEAAASAASVDAANLARIDQQNNFTEKQVFEIIPQTGIVLDAINSEAVIAASDLASGGNRGLRYVTRDFGQHRFLVSGNARMTISSGGVTAFNNFSVRQDTFLEGELTAQGNVAVGSGASPADLTVAGGVVTSTLKIEEEADTAGATRLVRFAKSRASVGYQNNGLTLSTLDNSKDIKCVIGSNEIMRIDGDNNGRVGIGTQTPASKLHVAGDLTVDGNIINASLPVIETGTWTPVFTATAGGEVGAGIVQRNGEYVKVGTQVTVYFRYNTTSSAAANLTIERLTGLPFPVKDTVDNHAVGSVQTVNIQFGDSDPHLIALNNTSTALIRYNRSNAAATVPTAPSNGGSFTIRGSLTYQTN